MSEPEIPAELQAEPPSAWLRRWRRGDLDDEAFDDAFYLSVSHRAGDDVAAMSPDGAGLPLDS